MRKNFLVALLLIGVFIISVIFGYFIMSVRYQSKNNNHVGNMSLAQTNNTNESVETSKPENVISPNEVVDNNEIYIVKEFEGRIAIYRSENDGQLALEEVTDILTKYLSEEDLIALREGISATGIKALTHLIEDFE